MTINLDELERLAKAAAPGPWCDRGFGSIQPESGGSLVAVTVTKGGCLPDYVENSAYIAAANPAAILELIADVRRLRNLLACRPALNSGLIEAYRQWTAVVYDSEAARAKGKS
jgi:hypothetical protein